MDRTLLNKDTWYTTVQLNKNLFGIAEFGHYEEVISYLIIGDSSAALIDTGMGIFSMKAEVQKITSLPCSVFNTHSHFDHVGSNSEFNEIKLFNHPRNKEVALKGFSSDYLSKWISNQNFWGLPPLDFKQPYEIKPFANAKFIEAQSRLILEPFEFLVIHTPGHSDDSVSFYEPNQGWLFVGDLIYDGPIFIQKQGGLAKYKQSIETIAKLNNLTQIFCSHNAFEITHEQFKKIRDKLAKISSVELESTFEIEGRIRLVPS